MRNFKADLHVHTLLSPCGSLEMSPANIVESALGANLDIIAITDHNSTKQAPLVKMLGERKGLSVVCGAEVNTLEEVHCLALFEDAEQLAEFQQFIESNIMRVNNKPSVFGEQVVVDQDEMIIEEVDYLLIGALRKGLVEVEREVHRLGGLVIPAHIDRYYNGLFSQLGFVPANLEADAFELSSNADVLEWERGGKIPKGKALIRSSDAHHPHQIGKVFTLFQLEAPSFNEIKLAFCNKDGRKVLPLSSSPKNTDY